MKVFDTDYKTLRMAQLFSRKQKIRFSDKFMQYWVIACVILAFAYTSSSAQFQVNGAAVANGGCYVLTSGDPIRERGAAWDNTKIDLTQTFDRTYYVMVGCRDANGADGMALVFHNAAGGLNTLGGSEMGVGYNGISPSVAIELDTYDNTGWGVPDIPEDHIAIVYNGNIFRNEAGPVQASATNVNIEDCQCHTFRVVWEPASKTFTVYFDGVRRLTHTDDIITKIFGGDPIVYVGFTASTGGFQNMHYFCPTPIPENARRITAHQGEVVTLNTLSGYPRYSWSPSTGLDCDTCANPTFVATASQMYKVAVQSPLGCLIEDSVFVEVTRGVQTPLLCIENYCNSVIASVYDMQEGTFLDVEEAENVLISEMESGSNVLITARLIDSLRNGKFSLSYSDDSYNSMEHHFTLPGFTVHIDTLMHNFTPFDNYLCDTLVIKNPEKRTQKFTYSFTSEDDIIFFPSDSDNTITLAGGDTAHVVICYRVRSDLLVARAEIALQDACNRVYRQGLMKSLIPASVAEDGEESAHIRISNGAIFIKEDCTIRLFSVIGKEIQAIRGEQGAVHTLPKGHILVVVDSPKKPERHLIYVD